MGTPLVLVLLNSWIPQGLGAKQCWDRVILGFPNKKQELSSARTGELSASLRSWGLAGNCPDSGADPNQPQLGRDFPEQPGAGQELSCLWPRAVPLSTGLVPRCMGLGQLFSSSRLLSPCTSGTLPMCMGQEDSCWSSQQRSLGPMCMGTGPALPATPQARTLDAEGGQSRVGAAPNTDHIKMCCQGKLTAQYLTVQ